MDDTPLTLVDVFAPYSLGQFIHNHLGKTFRDFPGTVGKFSSLLTWQDLNQILSLHQLDSPRLRLARDGNPIAAESFISYQPARRLHSSPTTRIRSTEFTHPCQQGATLILAALDNLHPPVLLLTATPCTRV